MDINDYLRGMEDCKAGRSANTQDSEDYNRGYATQYQHEQNLTESSLQVERLKQHRAWN